MDHGSHAQCVHCPTPLVGRKALLLLGMHYEGYKELTVGFGQMMLTFLPKPLACHFTYRPTDLT